MSNSQEKVLGGHTIKSQAWIMFGLICSDEKKYEAEGENELEDAENDQQRAISIGDFFLMAIMSKAFEIFNTTLLLLQEMI